MLELTKIRFFPCTKKTMSRSPQEDNDQGERQKMVIMMRMILKIVSSVRLILAGETLFCLFYLAPTFDTFFYIFFFI